MILSRYLIREVVTALIAVIVILLLAFLSQQLVRYLNYVAIGKIPLNVLLELVSFEVPYLLALLLPLSLYLGILLAFGRLYDDNEIAVMKMSGFTENHILKLIFGMAVIVSGFILVLMLWANPLISALRQQIMQSDEATRQLIKTLMPGRFQVSSDGTHVMYAEKLSRDHVQAENIFIAKAVKATTKTDQDSWVLVLANQGYQSKDALSSELFFVTTDGFRYEGTPGQNDYKIIQFKKYAIRIPENEMHITHKEDEALTTLQLLHDYANPRRAAEFQWRFSIAISALLLALFAVPLSSIRPRQGRYVVLLPAVLFYIIYINLLFVARHWVEQGTISTLIGMWWVHGLILLFVLFALMSKSKSWIGKL